MDELDGLTRVTRSLVRPAVATLSDAFMDYPVAVFFMPDEKIRKKRQPAIYRLVVGSAIAYGEVYITSPQAEGTAVWQMVDKRQPAPKRGSSLGWWWQNLFTDKETGRRQQAFMEYSNEIRARLMPDRYWYLQMLGVAPAFQGQGYSSRLLTPMLARADREGLPVFLETQLKKNVTLYEHFGFKLMEEGTITGSDVYSWAMVREPQK